jgi:hypothetical protein
MGRFMARTTGLEPATSWLRDISFVVSGWSIGEYLNQMAFAGWTAGG